MICDNCGMTHVRGENKLCHGPFIFQAEHDKALQHVAAQFYYMRNQYYHRLQVLGTKPPDEDLEVIVGLQAEVERAK